jgi:hypothetical protein
MAYVFGEEMKPAAITLLGCALLCGCDSNRLPEPYAGYTHSSAEHGYWREATDNNPRIGELHLHSKGVSVTYEPFETYKDYWGTSPSCRFKITGRARPETVPVAEP